MRSVGTGSHAMASFFANLNRSKRSIAIDLQREESHEILNALIDSADVVVNSFRSEAALRLGIDAESVTRGRPKIIYASIDGFGASGPFAGRPVYDHIIQATSGMADLQRESADDDPHLVKHGVVDKCTGLVLAQSICAALVQRSQTGFGTALSISMLDVAVSLMWPDGMMDRTAIDPQLRLPAIALTFRLTPTSDGHVSLVVLTRAQWDSLITALDLKDFIGESSNSVGMPRQPGRILSAARVAIRKLSSAAVEQLLTEHDVPCAVVVKLDEISSHPQIVANKTLLEYDHPLIGPIQQPRATPHFPATVSPEIFPAPGLGDHSEKILQELGYDATAIMELLQSGVVTSSRTS